MASTIVLWNKETNKPVSENGTIEFEVVNNKTGEVSIKPPYVVGVHLNTMFILELSEEETSEKGEEDAN